VGNRKWVGEGEAAGEGHAVGFVIERVAALKVLVVRASSVVMLAVVPHSAA
jgi:hypothetical protein